MRLILKMMALTVLIATGMTFGQAQSKSGAGLEAVRVTVYFQVGQTTLTDEAEAVLDEAAKSVQQGGSARVTIVGHADKSGPEDLNRKIAVARAEVVKQGLIERGVAPDTIVVSATTSRDAGPHVKGFISERRTDVTIEPEPETTTGF